MPKKRVPHKMTPAVLKVIQSELEAHANRMLAAQAAGISRWSFHQWTTRGREDTDAGVESPYTRFLDMVETAEAVWAQRLIERIETASMDTSQWRAAAWMLEKKFPDEYARLPVSKMELSGRDGGPIETVTMMQDARRRLMDGLDNLADDDGGA
jgi:sirohydrochlorin ferrochelatase